MDAAEPTDQATLDRWMAVFGWTTSAKSCGWFLSSLCGGAVAMHHGVRGVCFAAALAFLLLVPLTMIVASREERIARCRRQAEEVSAMPIQK